jgi:NADH-quinone oxidoreductase subunit G
MPKLVIDGHEIEVPQGTKVIEAAERLGIIIPRFCYHPALSAVGACRVCAVKFAEGPVKGIQMSCMTEARDGMVVSTTDEEAVDFRRQVMEWLMMNHPHDCPVCDEGGHCLLQDLTVAGGHGIRRYLGNKRTYRDQYLGAFVQHEMNRCIHCYRCWRFYQEFAGYRDLGCMQNAYRTYFGRFSDGPLESPFAGNLIDICPTGVYTDKPTRFTGRRWDFERTPSLCIHCSLGCNTVSSTRYRQTVRQEARFNKSVNGFFICDRGRYGFFYESHPARPRRPRIGKEEASWQEALQMAAATLARINQDSGPGSVACLGSTRSSLENQAMLKRFCQLQEWENPRYLETRSMARKIQKARSRLEQRIAVSMREIEGADFILAVGADPINEAPMLALAMRQAFRDGAGVAPMFPLAARPIIEGTTVIVLDPRPVFLPLEFDHFPVAPGEIDLVMNRLVKSCVSRTIAAELGPEALRFYDAIPEDYPPGPFRDRLAGIEQKLQQSKKPVIICGTEIVREATISSAADDALLLKAAKNWAGLFYLMPAANTFGAALLSASGGSLEDIIAGIEKGTVRALVVVENDPFWIYPDQERMKQALAKLDSLLVLDYLPSRIARQAHVFFPTAPLFETRASYVNQEGRIQFAEMVHAGGTSIAQVGGGNHPPRVYGAGIPDGEPKPAWKILAGLAEAILSAGKKLSGQVSLPQTIEDLWQWMAHEHPAFAGLQPFAVPPEGFRLLPDQSKEQAFSLPPSPSPSRGEGREGVNANSLELLLVDWTFGTEELSSYSQFIQPVEKIPCLLMHAEDAGRLGVNDKDRVVIHLDGGPLEVGLGIVENMSPGVIILPRHRQLAWQKMKDIPARIPVERIRKI